MAKPVGSCPSCGAGNKKLQASYGKKVCGNCSIVRTNAKLRPQVLVDALKEFSPNVLSSCLPAGDSGDSMEPAERQVVVNKYEGQLVVLREKIIKLENELNRGQSEGPSLAEGKDLSFLMDLAWNMAESMATKVKVNITWEDIEYLKEVSELVGFQRKVVS